ncbi:uncharacterized protein [Montipora capricornis]|uniref:uncharacterized protein n=1 Tax=Montipora capricornis TaxID=246305 RepID=UPI0035F136B2
MTGKKNKPGDRGSTEEETNAAKRSNKELIGQEEVGGNMADNDEVCDAEPTLYDIRNMLEDLQKSVSSILKVKCISPQLKKKENAILREDLTQFKSSLQSKEREVSALKTSFGKVSKANALLKTELEKTKLKLREQEDETEKLYIALDELEQYTRKNSLEIQGIPDQCYSTTEEVVLKLAGVLNVNVNPTDIEISHKLKRRGNNSSPIIVKFLSHKVKTNFYKERVKLRNAKVTDLFPGYSNAVSSNVPSIFLNENLTVYRRELVSRASEMKKDRLLTSFWTMDGKIFVKTSPSGNPVRIFSDYDLDNL